ncbi:hypothetical protein F3C99_05330 [Vitellibacter sp. q18]|nr:hypothetical protein [Aequorivita lutea]
MKRDFWNHDFWNHDFLRRDVLNLDRIENKGNGKSKPSSFLQRSGLSSNRRGSCSEAVVFQAVVVGSKAVVLQTVVVRVAKRSCFKPSCFV